MTCRKLWKGTESKQLNDELLLICPDAFQVMSEEETAGFLVSDQGEGVCLKAQELHMVLSAGWKKAEGAGGTFAPIALKSNIVSRKEDRIRCP